MGDAYEECMTSQQSRTPSDHLHFSDTTRAFGLFSYTTSASYWRHMIGRCMLNTGHVTGVRAWEICVGCCGLRAACWRCAWGRWFG